jgi:HEXXH motif-containing protein
LLGVLIANWEPAGGVGVDGESLRRFLLQAAAEQQLWLHHPCVDALTRAECEGQPASGVQTEFQLAVWAGLHGAPSLGSVDLVDPVWAWAPDGGEEVPAGRCDLDVLVASLAGRDWPWDVAIDVWCRTIGAEPAQQSWAETPPSSAEEQLQLQSDLTMFLHALAGLERCLPACYAWVTAATQVVIPMRRVIGKAYSRSASSPQIPGLAYITLRDELQILEALVHETAHHHLFLVQAAGPLVDPSHTALYRSPLRPDPRPLLGVLLAYHALIYICALYADILRHDLGPEARVRRELQISRGKMLDAAETILTNRGALTDLGATFVETSTDVAGFCELV